MPGFIKTKSQEARWQAAKKAAAKSKNKSLEDLKDDDFALVNYIYHKMGKTEEDFKKAEELKKILIDKPSKAPSSISASKSSLAIPNTKKSLITTNVVLPSTRIKGASIPKQKTMPTISDNSSKHFKPLKASEEQKSEIEEFQHMKHPNLHKLLDFIRKKHKRIE